MLLDLTTTTLVEWSRWQFAMTAIYHYMFVPLTLGLALMLAIMETMWVKTGDQSWLNATRNKLVKLLLVRGRYFRRPAGH